MSEHWTTEVVFTTTISENGYEACTLSYYDGSSALCNN